MTKLLIYRILFIANIAISVLLFAFIFIGHLQGMMLGLSILLTATGIAGAMSMYREIQRSVKNNASQE